MQEQTLIEKIKSLPPEKVAEVEDFVDFIVQRNTRSSRHAGITAYAAQYAGSPADLDPELEAAAVEHLRDQGRG